MTDSDADASLHPLPDEKSDALPLFCKWLGWLVFCCFFAVPFANDCVVVYG